jgi:hypothetical protein
MSTTFGVGGQDRNVGIVAGPRTQAGGDGKIATAIQAASGVRTPKETCDGTALCGQNGHLTA